MTVDATHLTSDSWSLRLNPGQAVATYTWKPYHIVRKMCWCYNRGRIQTPYKSPLTKLRDQFPNSARNGNQSRLE